MIHRFLVEESYWAQTRTFEQTKRAILNSLCFGVYLGDRQIGFGRVVTDYATFAYVGDVFVLDMGSPVRITDLAKRMIHLAGYTVRDEKNPEGDIEIRFTGLRPAEKLFEELLIGKNVTGTEHPRILRAMEHSLTWEQIRHVLDDLAHCSIRFDCERAREVLLRAVPEYRPADRVQDHVWLHGGSRVSGAVLTDEEKVRELRPRAPA
jgi:hypothetical protein